MNPRPGGWDVKAWYYSGGNGWFRCMLCSYTNYNQTSTYDHVERVHYLPNTWRT